MSENLQETIERHRNDPETRALLEDHLAKIAIAEPEEAAYWRAYLDGDVRKVKRILTQRRILKLREETNKTPASQRYLQHLTNRLNILESGTGAALQNEHNGNGQIR